MLAPLPSFYLFIYFIWGLWSPVCFWHLELRITLPTCHRQDCVWFVSASPIPRARPDLEEALLWDLGRVSEFQTMETKHNRGTETQNIVMRSGEGDVREKQVVQEMRLRREAGPSSRKRSLAGHLKELGSPQLWPMAFSRPGWGFCLMSLPPGFKGKQKALQIHSVICFFPGRSELPGLQDRGLGLLAYWDMPQGRVTKWASFCFEPEQ